MKYILLLFIFFSFNILSFDSDFRVGDRVFCSIYSHDIGYIGIVGYVSKDNNKRTIIDFHVEALNVPPFKMHQIISEYSGTRFVTAGDQINGFPSDSCVNYNRVGENIQVTNNDLVVDDKRKDDLNPEENFDSTTSSKFVTSITE